MLDKKVAELINTQVNKNFTPLICIWILPTTTRTRS